jgi:hypothetical protein
MTHALALVATLVAPHAIDPSITLLTPDLSPLEPTEPRAREMPPVFLDYLYAAPCSGTEDILS